MRELPASAGGRAARRSHLYQIDVIRLLPMLGVVAVHTLIWTQPPESVGANAAQMLLHANREVFFFVTAFVLCYSTGAVASPGAARRFWRRRYPWVVLPYLAWTLIYWFQVENATPWPPLPALQALGGDLALGWFHLYFLLVTMQLYAVYPLLAWLIRRTRGHHWWLLGCSVALQVAFTALIQYAWGWYIPGPLWVWFQYAQVEVTSYQLYFILGALVADHLPECLAWLREHRGLAAAGAVAALAASEGWYWLNMAVIHEDSATAIGVFQPAALLVVLGALVGLFLLGDSLVRTQPRNGRVWRTLQRTSRLSFGVYLAHMLPMQLLLWTPLASTVVGGMWMPLPVRAVYVFVIVLGSTLGLVALLQRTALSQLLTGRPRLSRDRGREAAGSPAALPQATEAGAGSPAP